LIQWLLSKDQRRFLGDVLILFCQIVPLFDSIEYKWIRLTRNCLGLFELH
jgi:hypothetical protein